MEIVAEYNSEWPCVPRDQNDDFNKSCNSQFVTISCHCCHYQSLGCQELQRKTKRSVSFLGPLEVTRLRDSLLSVLFFSVSQSGGPAMSLFNLLQLFFMYLLHCHNICELLRRCGKGKYNKTDFQYSLPFTAVTIGVTRDVILIVCHRRNNTFADMVQPCAEGQCFNKFAHLNWRLFDLTTRQPNMVSEVGFTQ